MTYTPPRSAQPARGELPDHAYAAALTCLPGATWRRLRSLLGGRSGLEAWQLVEAGGAVALWCGRSGGAGGRAEVVGEWARAARAIDVAGVWGRCRDLGFFVLVRDDRYYPEAWRDDPEAPAVVFAAGDLSALSAPPVALVGTRSATHYGEDVAAELGAALSESGVAVVSGLALGIDAAAHGGALAAGGAPPVGVVATGIDVVYPRAHRGLWRRMVTEGLLLSENPPGTEPSAWRFPERNRLIAALSAVVVVVESHGRGGALYTAEAAARRGAALMAVPGSVRSPASVGTNALLADGAAPARDVRDVLAALALQGRFPRRSAPGERAEEGRRSRRAPTTVERGDDRLQLEPGAPMAPRPAPDERRLLEALEWEPATVETLLLRTGLSLGRAALALESLRDRGAVRGDGGWWTRSRRASR